MLVTSVLGDQESGPGGRKGMELTPLDRKPGRSVVDELAAARLALELSTDAPGPPHAIRAAVWHWDLASGRVQWDARLKALFGYAETVTDAAWRESRIHPEDRDRVKVSLQRATIANPGAVWSDQYRFRLADGSYTTVDERRYVVNDDAGPRGDLGSITPP